MTIRVLVADDQSLVRDGFAAILRGPADIEVVGEAADGEEAVARARELVAEVVLMDIRMPRLDGIEATRRLCGDPAWKGRVIVLTTFDADELVWDALHAGASGFLLKTTTAAELVGAVRVVSDGTALLAPEVTGRLVREFMHRPRPGGPAPELTQLTDRESDVFRRIAEGRTNHEIADALHVSESTVKTHVNRVFTKLGLRDRTHAAIYAYESGFITPGDRRDPP
ncbi:response regulator transcription factor [Nocardioides sp.]|uniref:response regulator transcription factor n=1 Tax=Nocardioides sp. TaxID=35761 RepID=UPI002ED7869F